MKKNSKKIPKAPQAPHQSKLRPSAMSLRARPEPTRMGRGPTKTFQQDGHWIVKVKKTAILVCECGNKYLKTRPQQHKCLRCLAYLTTSGNR